ncbi:mycothione reductase [Nocardioides iriomotensis]|uniref:Mycothione reductase n=1 Tax=Nocardioides iriomotensis TaxID=715784 RepID=A0A4Q5J015_9ACTN|nr:mycothione reductase [Nocardioides iriomotensis]RYU10701.1 mycothione reductase [Nocardioides iriomotensis]
MTHYDLAVIGTGSGNTIVDESFDGWKVAIVEKGVFGGTCLNRGCIPTKMFVYPADLAYDAGHSAPLGVDTSFEGARWREIRDRIFGRIDPISASGREWRATGLPDVSLVEGHARFIDPHTLDVASDTGVETITAEQVVIATGSRPTLPDVPGLDDVPFHTSDTVMRIDDVPPRVLVLGGGFVAAEFAHVFSSFGSAVTIVNRSSLMLRAEDQEVAERFTEIARARWDVRLRTTITKVERLDGSETGVRAQLDDGTTVEADLLLVAAGRRSNSDDLGLQQAGVAVDETGLVVVDDHQRTNVKGIWALGDVSNRFQLKHVSNNEARVIRHNLLHPTDLASSDHVHVPSAVFSHPQVASIGLTEEDARERGVDVVVGRRDYSGTAYGWAMEDETSFAKVLADPHSGLLLGAHIIGPQASNLIQPLVMAMSLGIPAHEVARGQYWIHPAMTEVVENALLALPLTP